MESQCDVFYKVLALWIRFPTVPTIQILDLYNSSYDFLKISVHKLKISDFLVNRASDLKFLFNLVIYLNDWDYTCLRWLRGARLNYMNFSFSRLLVNNLSELYYIVHVNAWLVIWMSYWMIGWWIANISWLWKYISKCLLLHLSYCFKNAEC